MQLILLLDASMVVILCVLSSLSKRLGEALKTPSFYVLYYAATAFISVAALLNAGFFYPFLSKDSFIARNVPMALRFIAGIVSVFSSWQYWKWVFKEFLKN